MHRLVVRWPRPAMPTSRRHLFPLVALLAVLGAGILPCHVPSASAQAPEGPAEIRLILTEWALTPAHITVPVGRTIRFLAINIGVLPHALAVEGDDLYEESETVGAGQTAPLEITFTIPGVYDIYCPVGAGQHRDLGQEGRLVVTAAIDYQLPRTGEEVGEVGNGADFTLATPEDEESLGDLPVGTEDESADELAGAL
jgi:plastocyanin